MPFARLLERLRPRRPAEASAPLRLPYSGRVLTVSGLVEDESVYGQIAKHGVWEPHIMALLAKLIPRSGVCLDIGANIGAHTLAMADLAPSGTVFAFEPSTANAAMLARNIRQNGFGNVRRQALGLGAAEGRLEFANLVGLAGCSFVKPASATAREVIDRAWGAGVEHRIETVEIVTLDDWAAAHRVDRIDVVKMDVEGFEIAVLEGGRNTFARHRPALVMELNRSALGYFGARPADLYERLAALYPSIHVIEDPSGALLPVESFETIGPLLDRPGHWWVDLLCRYE